MFHQHLGNHVGTFGAGDNVSKVILVTFTQKFCLHVVPCFCPDLTTLLYAGLLNQHDRNSSCCPYECFLFYGPILCPSVECVLNKYYVSNMVINAKDRNMSKTRHSLCCFSSKTLLR